MTRKSNISRIELEFGLPFDHVIADFAKEYSFTFTIQALGLNKTTFSYLKPLFTPRKMQRQERPHVAMMNLSRANAYQGYTVRQIVQMTGLSRSTVYNRIRIGWSVDKILKTKPTRGNINNLGKNRNKSTWKSIISNDCELMKLKKAP